MRQRGVYTRLGDTISSGIHRIPDIDLVENTNELARINKVDPLGITDMRVRGMWLIQNPAKVFNYLPDTDGKFANLLMLTSKYNSFPEEDRSRVEALVDNKFEIVNVRIKDPNNPANLLDAKLLTLEK